MRALFVGNQKGGTGKTTVAVNLSVALARLGYRVRLIDADPHHGCTSHLGFDPDSDARLGLVELLAGRVDADDVVCSVRPPAAVLAAGLARPRAAAGATWPPGFTFIPASRELDRIDDLIPPVRFGDPAETLVPVLASAFAGQDVVLVDTGPTLTTPTRAAYFACDLALLVAQPHTSSIPGLERALADVEEVRRRPGGRCQVAGIVLNDMDNRTRHVREYELETERRGWAPYHFAAGIRTAATLRRAWLHGVPVALFQPTSFSVGEFDALALELARRIGLPPTAAEEEPEHGATTTATVAAEPSCGAGPPVAR